MLPPEIANTLRSFGLTRKVHIFSSLGQLLAIMPQVGRDVPQNSDKLETIIVKAGSELQVNLLDSKEKPLLAALEAEHEEAVSWFELIFPPRKTGRLLQPTPCHR